MKTAILTTLLLISVSSYAATYDETAIVSASGAAVEQYNYSTDLDIAKVISMSSIPQVCEVVPAQMVYEDSHGKRHILEYRVMGDGCRN